MAQKMTISEEKAARFNAMYNRDCMVEEAKSAKESGLSYGMFKAGMKRDKESTEYGIHQTEVLHRTEKPVEDKKPVAVIKRGVR